MSAKLQLPLMIFMGSLMIFSQVATARAEAPADPSLAPAAVAQAQFESERDSSRLTGPRTGVAMSSVGMVLASGGLAMGMMLTFAGVLDGADNGPDATRKKRAGSATLALSAVVLGASIVGLVRSAKKLGRRKTEARNLTANALRVHPELAPPPAAPAMIRF